jgi:hypothetical protein
MATRQIRPRPVDQNKPLEIIRDFAELDGTTDAATGQQLATTLESIMAAAEVSAVLSMACMCGAAVA